jgi:hypothetical protein
MPLRKAPRALMKLAAQDYIITAQAVWRRITEAVSRLANMTPPPPAALTTRYFFPQPDRSGPPSPN